MVGPEDPSGHLHQKYSNSIIGRYTNRVPVGTHTVTRDGCTTQVTPQATVATAPTISLHGGPHGFDTATFTPIPLDAASPSGSGPGSLFTAAELVTLQTAFPSGSCALFRHTSQDGDQGYPGTVLVEVVVGLLPPQSPGSNAEEYHLGSAVFIYRAKLVDEGKKVVTPINLTQVCFALYIRVH